MSRVFVACKKKVLNRGNPPDGFLNEIIDWAKSAPDEIFAPNAIHDIYSNIVHELGPWQNITHRKAAMLEVMRVEAGFESSWKWGEGVDKGKREENTLRTEEAGIFQCSCNSMGFDPSLKALLMKAAGKTDCETFIKESKSNHPFAIEYFARLVRFTVDHHGPIKRKEINPWLSREAVSEFERFLKLED